MKRKLCSIFLIIMIILNSFSPIISWAATDEEMVSIKFKDKNLYTEIKKKTNVKDKIASTNDSTCTIKIPKARISSITSIEIMENKEITDLSGIEKFTGLIELKVVNNKIADVTPLEKLTKITSLVLNNNKITDITSLKNMTNLENLYLSNNQITDISPLKDLKNLVQLYLYDNQITDVSPLKDLKNLKILYLNDNQIEDITELAHLINLPELRLDYNKITNFEPIWNLIGMGLIVRCDSQYITMQVNSTESSFYAPLIFCQAINEDSPLYTRPHLEDSPLYTMSHEEVTYTNCRYVGNGKIEIEDTSKKTAQIKIGESDNYDAKKPLKGTVITINIKQVTTPSTDDNNNNNNNTTTEEKDTTPPDLKFFFSSIEPTNQDVKVTITADEEIKCPTGWNLMQSKKGIQKTYTQNTTGDGEEVYISDLAGNAKKAWIKIENIDKIAPNCSVKYSENNTTNKDVTVTITAKEKIKSVSGWTLSTDAKVLTKKYTVNTELPEYVIVKDLAGNETKLEVNVTNIDKKAPVIKKYPTNPTPTQENVSVLLIANEEIKQVSGWTLQPNKRSLIKEFKENTTEPEIVKVEDLAGNVTEVSVSVSHIDREAPRLQPYDMSHTDNKPTNKDIELFVIANEKIASVESLEGGWEILERWKII